MQLRSLVDSLNRGICRLTVVEGVTSTQSGNVTLGTHPLNGSLTTMRHFCSCAPVPRWRFVVAIGGDGRNSMYTNIPAGLTVRWRIL
jgi:hypothetical protein